MKTRVAYYSHSGNNRILATKLAAALGADLEEIQPVCGAFFFQLLFTAFGHGPGVYGKKAAGDDVDSLVLVAPLWMGSLAWPARVYLRSRGKRAKLVHVVTCCGSNDAGKDDPFGYETAFAKFRVLLGTRAGTFQALPSVLALPAEKRAGEDAAMAARLSESSFAGEITERLASIVAKIGK